MKFGKFTGTKDNGRRDDFDLGATARVSDATRRAASGVPDRATLEDALNDLDREREAALSRIVQIEDRLNQLNGRVVGRHVPQHEYDRVCQEQSDLKKEMAEIRVKLGDLKARRRKLQTDSQTEGGLAAQLAITNGLLRQLIKEIRGLATRPHSDPD